VEDAPAYPEAGEMLTRLLEDTGEVIRSEMTLSSSGWVIGLTAGSFVLT